MIRKAVPADIQAVTALGIEALNVDPYPGLLVNPEKVKMWATECISGAQNFAWVSEHDGQVVGAVLAHVHEAAFYERKQADVLMCYVKKSGDGIALLREMVRWVRSRPAIKVLHMALERHQDERMGALLERLGFERECPGYVLTR